MFCEPGFYFFIENIKYTSGNYLEIGVFNGDSLYGIAKQYPDRIIYGIDPFVEDGCTTHTTNVNINQPMPVQKHNTMNYIKNLDNVVFFETFSNCFSDLLTDEMVSDMNVSSVLIDGSHHFHDVINDVHLAMRLIGNKPGFIVFDDCKLPGVAPAYQSFLTTYKDCISPGHILDHRNSSAGNIIAHAINNPILP